MVPLIFLPGSYSQLFCQLPSIDSWVDFRHVYYRERREEAFTAAVDSIVTRGGSCLIPVFALGRAQELLLILDEYWQENPQLQVERCILSCTN